MLTRTVQSLETIAATQWNALVSDGHPFLRHEFLTALERNDCVGERTGWFAHHVVCLDDNGQLLGASPMYVKTNSYGEFVFDWSWADAYRRCGLAYYPKLVSAVPFTPATGNRLLIRPDADRQTVAEAIIKRTLAEARRLHCSSIHWLFPTAGDAQHLHQQGMMRRTGCQFHWHNPGYRDFQDFLDSLTAKKRKNINRERRIVRQRKLELTTLLGSEANDAQWRLIHAFYRETFERLGGIATLTLPFFQEIGATLGNRIVLVLARDGARTVAAAISFLGDRVLYGRHWGCHGDYDSLHFEACYYQGIDFCIRHGLRRFEPGAQGEHKISRGFLPTHTYSVHWLSNPGLRSAVADFLDRETPLIHDYARDLAAHSPYRALQHPQP